MTRETKIGLLVGLAFIIVIGILLSDHLSSSTEPPSATLVQAGTNVRQQVATPAGTQQPVQQITPPAAVVPTNPVATQRDLTPPVQPQAVVQVGPVTQANNPPIVVTKPTESAMPVESATPTEPPVTMASSTPTAQEQASTPVETSAPVEMASNSDNALNKVVAEQGEQLITPNGQPVSGLPQPKKVAASTVAGKDYVIQPGDTISKLATRFMGSNTKANRDLIIKANPSLAANPDKLVVGKSYRIPSVAGNSASAAAVAPTPAPVAVTVPETAPVAKTAPVQLASDGVVFYTVKAGDSLWKISSEQLGKGGSGVAAIKELNKDVLKGGEIVTEGMKLRMPGKAIASAN